MFLLSIIQDIQSYQKKNIMRTLQLIYKEKDFENCCSLQPTEGKSKFYILNLKKKEKSTDQKKKVHIWSDLIWSSIFDIKGYKKKLDAVMKAKEGIDVIRKHVFFIQKGQSDLLNWSSFPLLIHVENCEDPLDVTSIFDQNLFVCFFIL